MLALVAKNASRRPSEIFRIEDELLALDFDAACAYRLLIFDNERENAKFERWEKMLGIGGENSGGVPEIEGGAKNWGQ
jgi:hypothetical protein